MEQTDDVFTCLKPTGGFEASVCRQMWRWLERRAPHMCVWGGRRRGLWPLLPTPAVVFEC